MIYVSLTLSELKREGACAEGIALFAACSHHGELDRRVDHAASNVACGGVA